MSKNKKQKKPNKNDIIRSQQIKKLEELEKLRNSMHELEIKIHEQKKENFKQFHIRNLKIFASTCNFATPFVLTTAITTTIFILFDGGLPFYLDETTKYKVYDLKFQTNGYVTMNEEYRTNSWLDESLPPNSLVIYTPWEKKDEDYVRFKREYDVGVLTDIGLCDAVLNGDYSYIYENLKNYKEEKQVINDTDFESEMNYYFDADLHILDKGDTIKYKETTSKNMSSTVVQLVINLSAGSTAAYFRKFKFINKLKEVNDDYKARIAPLKLMKKELNVTKNKILSLKSKGVTTNEK